MPKLPENRKEREFELLNKDSWNRGSLVKQKPFHRPRNLKLPKKPIGILLVAVIVLGGLYIFVQKYYPDLLKPKAPIQTEAKDFEYPVDINKISYPSDVLKEKFLANFKSASLEKDSDKRYKLLEENFIMLRGFYTASSGYDYRVQLEAFTDYMKKNFPKQVEINKNLYNYLCIDKQCGEVKSPNEIVTIAAEIAKEDAINSQVKEAVLRNFDAAGLNEKDQSANFYLSAYSMLISEARRTKDADVKVTTTKLYDFIVKSFPDIKIPDDLKL
ncbi:MAG: hypothetical protein AAB512_04390 [Patescibacteria group bacterium]